MYFKPLEHNVKVKEIVMKCMEHEDDGLIKCNWFLETAPKGL